MGMRGPVEKRTGRQRRASTSKVVELQPGRAPATDRPPAGREWLVVTKNLWAAFWSSELASLVCLASDEGALRRLFDMVDERERMVRVAKKSRMVRGSQGQLVLNPLLRYVSDLDKEIRVLEDRFGLTPMARLRVGAKFGEAAKSLEDVNRAFDEVARPADDDVDDPRRHAIDI